MDISFYKSPIGILKIICENKELISLKIVEKQAITKIDTDFTQNIKKQLNEYFAGKRKIFDIKTNPIGTNFQRLVWEELKRIPYGTTKSYSDIAHNIGYKNAQRAVGNACNKNPVMIVIPCHRVIAKNGNIGGFAYGNITKQKLLETEFKIKKYYAKQKIGTTGFEPATPTTPR